jgi:hypothetical protein
MNDMTQGADIRAALDASGLLDAAWYLRKNPDVAAAGMDPLAHYIAYGSAEGRQPNRWFDAIWYIRRYPDVPGRGTEPLLHYAARGDAEGRRPHPFFDAGWYRAAHALPENRSALRHFLQHRASGRYAPCQELYPVPFLPAYRGDPGAGRDPFAHYLDDMAKQRREPFPDLQAVAQSGLVDPDYHRINVLGPHDAALEPALHYCRFGWRARLRPNPYFDPVWYAASNPEVARCGVNPLVHYLLEGEAKGRRPVVWFDPAWYRATYGVSEERPALAHFLAQRGGGEVSPNKLFDVAWYVRRHGGVIGPDRDPFAHYLQAGAAAAYRREHMTQAGRAPHPDRLELDNPLVHYLHSQY